MSTLSAVVARLASEAAGIKAYKNMTAEAWMAWAAAELKRAKLTSYPKERKDCRRAARRLAGMAYTGRYRKTKYGR
jgi:hypothetical protein